jgi:hypothetical protein
VLIALAVIEAICRFAISARWQASTTPSHISWTILHRQSDVRHRSVNGEIAGSLNTRGFR